MVILLLLLILNQQRTRAPYICNLRVCSIESGIKKEPQTLVERGKEGKKEEGKDDRREGGKKEFLNLLLKIYFEKEKSKCFTLKN